MFNFSSSSRKKRNCFFLRFVEISQEYGAPKDCINMVRCYRCSRRENALVLAGGGVSIGVKQGLACVYMYVTVLEPLAVSRYRLFSRPRAVLRHSWRARVRKMR